jgi:RimJ/RimL family protein N-acetyltransferase
MTGRPTTTRIVRGLLRRLAWPSHNLLVVATRYETGAMTPAVPEGHRLVRIAAGAAANARHMAADAMRAVGEPDGLVASRLAHGDEFFGWAAGARIVCFGWVMTRDRAVGPFRLTNAPGRVFLYNFHTLPEHRGQGLCVALHEAIRSAFSRETASEFVADVNVHNIASRRCLEKSGFVPVARVSFLTLLRRWRCPLRRTRLEPHGVSLF